MTSLEQVRQQIYRAKRLNKTPAELWGFVGVQAYLWDQALDWLWCFDTGVALVPSKPEPPPAKDEVFGAYG